MSKGYILIDVPDTCSQCVFWYGKTTWSATAPMEYRCKVVNQIRIENIYEKPHWCPIIPLSNDVSDISINSANDVIRNKKKQVSSAEIIRRFIGEKTYYEIKYREIGKNEYNVGYGSYNLNYVLQWLNECFDFCEEAKVNVHTDNLIPVSKRLRKFITRKLIK